MSDAAPLPTGSAIKADWPSFLSATASSLEEAQAYCRQLAQSHYENFVVASLFLPSHLRQPFYDLYAYCRISDDLGDETGDPALSLELLAQWEQMVRNCYSGTVLHPVFISLGQTIERFEIPIRPFLDLLQAFRMDQIKKRYETYDELLEYCRFSANPVGRLVLYLGGYRDAERQSLSDQTCTGLQLANHWQDIALDFRRLDRIYLPREDMQQFGYTETDLQNGVCDERFRELMAFEGARARAMFQEGIKLVRLVDRRMARDIYLFNLAGLEVLNLLKKNGYNIFVKRPAISKTRAMGLVLRSWWQNRSLK